MHRVMTLARNPLLWGQVLSIAVALAQLIILARLLTVGAFADFALSTAVWSVFIAVVASPISLRSTKQSAARKSASLSLSVRDLIRLILGLGAATAILVGVGIGTYGVALVAVACLSFLASEIACGIDLGINRRWSFASRQVVRNLGPLLGAVLVLPFTEPTFEFVIWGAIVSNLIACHGLAKPTWTRHQPTHDEFSAMSFLSLSLWLIAVSDRIVLGFTTSASELAVYGIASGLVDKVFRASQNIYISSNLAHSFEGRGQKNVLSYRIAMASIALLVTPAAYWAIPWLTHGNYTPELSLLLVLTLASLIMSWTAPSYVAAVTAPRVAAVAGSAVVVAGIFLVLSYALSSVEGNFGMGLAKLAVYALWIAVLAGARRRRQGATK